MEPDGAEPARRQGRARASATRPGDLGAWQKLQLGWLDYEVAVKGNNTVINLGPEEYNSNKPQAIVVPLPKKQVATNNAPPHAGSKSWCSGAVTTSTTR